MAVKPHHLPLADLPDGVVATRIRRTRLTDAGEPVEVMVSGRLRRTDEVELIADSPRTNSSHGEDDIDPAEKRWLLDAGRRQWRSVEARYGEKAWQRAVELIRAGVVHVRCGVDEHMGLGQPRSWTLTEEWVHRRRQLNEQRERDRTYWRARAYQAADGAAERFPKLAVALRKAPAASSTTPVLVYAAEDLLEGVTHAGPRAFSQAHFGDTKARDDVADVLTRAGVTEDILIQLGIRRSARLGVAGPVQAVVVGEEVSLSLLHGPVLLRVDQPGLTLRTLSSAPVVIVENLQAAETLADQVPQCAVVYSAGFPSDRALRLIAGLVAAADRVLLVPDADLGGVRIAERILGVAPNAELVDIGQMDHPLRDGWPANGDTDKGLRAALGGSADPLARGCLERGYPVEQELATVDAVLGAVTGSLRETMG